ncbi:hypothetical protein BGX29_008218 [Mortierella sp. GBA35]|nr:hypothetical protein BGX23_006241 [Mortierella sp. AD031]KAF9108686.1 hypothetical protein BGX29_008218 [Mortierella sp. GBA35]KAG0214624.1 hypothetical protein BGX33_001984 [Mortierella sp. NVP41]
MSATVAKATLSETSVETITTVTVEETVASLVTVAAATASSTPAVSKLPAVVAESSNLHRELPIFSNPLLANATQSNSVPLKPKVARVKSGTKSLSVLKISAPKVDGEVVVMRRLDTDLVNATSMYNAAYPAISEKMDAKESAFVTKKYDGVVEKSGALAGVWITLPQAKVLANEYGIDQFMRPLLEAPNPKNGATNESEEVVEKTLKREAEDNIEEMEETSDKMDEHTVDDVKVMKRRIAELEDQATRDRKKFRGLAVVAAGLAAASVIPQVLPYFS